VSTRDKNRSLLLFNSIDWLYCTLVHTPSPLDFFQLHTDVTIAMKGLHHFGLYARRLRIFNREGSHAVIRRFDFAVSFYHMQGVLFKHLFLSGFPRFFELILHFNTSIKLYLVANLIFSHNHRCYSVLCFCYIFCYLIELWHNQEAIFITFHIGCLYFFQLIQNTRECSVYD
jgi:hypothetical protein